ncbi:hypothetical protein ACSMXN_16195 [Jatrophihabitans sp. DSM 45814]
MRARPTTNHPATLLAAASLRTCVGRILVGISAILAVLFSAAGDAAWAAPSSPEQMHANLTSSSGSPRPSKPAVTKLFDLADPRIDEASGLAVGIRSPEVLYLQNDSGDSARFFALDSKTGRTVAVCTVPDATNIDWEDLAVARDSAGTPSVWLADIGDNDENRADIAVYRVDEPALASDGPARDLVTARPEVWRLRYPDGPHNSEALVVDPNTHRLYIFTKSLFGQTVVYEAPPRADSVAVATLQRVGSIQFSLTGTPGGPNLVGELTATGASMSPDGSILVVRTYTDAYLWPVRGGNIGAALSRPPVRIALPAQPLGEGVAVQSGNLIIDSEQAGSAVYSIRIPSFAVIGTSAGSPDNPSAGANPAASAGPTRSAIEPAAAKHNARNRLILVVSLAVAALLVLSAIRGLIWLMRRRIRF